METEERKSIMKTALTNSFVDDYEAYKHTIEFINNDLKESVIQNYLNELNKIVKKNSRRNNLIVFIVKVD